MPQSPTAIKDFTLLPDVLVNQYGLVTAAVYGRVYRYCHMRGHTCFASLASIAKGLNVDRVTVMRHLAILVKDGYLLDSTPGIRNKPHTYKLTRKIRITIQIGVAESHTGVAESHTGVAQSNSGVAESHLRNSIKRVFKNANEEKD